MTRSGFPQGFTMQLSESPNGIISLRELMSNVNKAMDAQPLHGAPNGGNGSGGACIALMTLLIARISYGVYRNSSR